MVPHPLDDPSAEGGHVEIDRCVSCGGSFFEFFDGEPVHLAHRTLSEMPPTAEALASAVVSCPDCGEAMERRRYLGHGPELAQCETCMALFVTPTELRELARWREAREERPSGWLEKLVAWVHRV